MPFVQPSGALNTIVVLGLPCFTSGFGLDVVRLLLPDGSHPVLATRLEWFHGALSAPAQVFLLPVHNVKCRLQSALFFLQTCDRRAFAASASLCARSTSSDTSARSCSILAFRSGLVAIITLTVFLKSANAWSAWASQNILFHRSPCSLYNCTAKISCYKFCTDGTGNELFPSRRTY